MAFNTSHWRGPVLPDVRRVGGAESQRPPIAWRSNSGRGDRRRAEGDGGPRGDVRGGGASLERADRVTGPDRNAALKRCTSRSVAIGPAVSI